jgi:hypothetical protein
LRGVQVASLCLGAAALAVISGCGGGEKQDAKEPKGTFDVKIVSASFPSQQRLSQHEVMKIRVRNDGDKTVPNVAVSVGREGKDTFTYQDQQPGLADPQRPIWIIDDGPLGGTTAYVDTWALGRLKPHQTKTFSWGVTPIRPGNYKIDYLVAAGLNGKAKVRKADASGSFRVNVTRQPAQACVTDSGEVVDEPADSAGNCPST